MAVIFVRHLPTGFAVFESKEEVLDKLHSQDDVGVWIDFRTVEGPVLTLVADDIAAVVEELPK